MYFLALTYLTARSSSAFLSGGKLLRVDLVSNNTHIATRMSIVSLLLKTLWCFLIQTSGYLILFSLDNKIKYPDRILNNNHKDFE